MNTLRNNKDGGIALITIKPGCSKTLSCSIDNVESIAYDGCDYALLRTHRDGITRLDEELCSLGTHRCAKTYTCICFDLKECCYYACAQGQPALLYVLDLNFHEIKTITIPTHHEKSPCAMSAHPTCSILLLLYEKELLFWDYYRDEIVNCIDIGEHKHVLDIIALEDGYALSYYKEDRACIEIICGRCRDSCIYMVPEAYELQAMVLMEACKDRYEIQLLLQSCEHEQVSILLYVTCGYEEPTPSPCPMPHPIEVTCEGGKNEVIHSIALEEAGIAHILNAEGEKLQKAVASDISIEELLMVNESVRKTITQITLLEGQLYSKLESLHCLCMEEED